MLSGAHAGDVGHWIFVGDQLMRGRVPFADFNGLYGPVLLAFFGAAYRLCGANWSAALFQLEAVSPALCLVLAYWISGRALKGAAWRALFVAAVALIGLDHFFWSPALRVWLPLGALVLAESALAAGDFRALALACLLCGACPWISLDAGGAAVIGLVVLFAVRGRRARLSPRRLAVCAAALAAPTSVMFAAFPHMSAAFLRTDIAMVGRLNWVYGAPLPPRPGLLAAFCWFAPFACAAAGALCGELPLAAFAAVSLRTALGRSDYGHLIFCLPAVVLLWLRLASRARAPKAAPVLAALGLLPFVAFSASDPDGDLARWARRAESRSIDTTDWPEEGLRAPAAFAARARRIADEVARRVPPDGRVLSLPVPIYAHLARRESALPASSAEQIEFGPGGPAGFVASLAADPPPLVVLDPALALPLRRLDDIESASSADPLDGRLTWATSADEAITRELRDYLRANYALADTIDGASLYVRRERPATPPPPARLVAVDAPTALDLGRGYLIPVPAALGRELRFSVRCAYPAGLSSLAKTFAVLGYVEKSGVQRSAIIPVPPASVGRDLRIPLPPVPLREAAIEVFSPGAFNPAPSAVVLDSLTIVEMSRPD